MRSSIQSAPSVKVIGGSGQISLGKQFARGQVLVEEQEEGVWLIRTATVIPDNERRIHEPAVARRLHSAVAYADAHSVDSANVDAVLEALIDGKR